MNLAVIIVILGTVVLVEAIVLIALLADRERRRQQSRWLKQKKDSLKSENERLKRDLYISMSDSC